MSLSNQLVVVLGGSSGIGLETARAAAAAGARVVVTGRSRERLRAAERTLGGVRTVALDSTDEAGTRDFFAGLDRVDHVFVTAGTLTVDSKLAPESESLRSALDGRFWSALYAAKYAAPKMRPGGSITFMSGTTSIRPVPGVSVATASCGAVEAFARALAVDLAPVRVNAVQPGLVDTPFLDPLFGEGRAEAVAAFGAKLPVGRIGRSEEVADAVLFLMRNEYVTGIALRIDGGGALV